MDSFHIMTDHQPQRADVRRKVLVTGAAGRIGSYFCRHSCDRYELTLMDHPDVDCSHIQEYGRVVKAKLEDRAALESCFGGQDTIVHLAANPNEHASWEELLSPNIIGTYNAFMAAKAASCRRLIYASSIHAVGGYPADQQVQADEPVNPPDLYGVTKCFGEALGRYMAEQQGLSTIVIRIGAFQPPEEARKPAGIGMVDMWISPRDMNHLLGCCIDNENLLFAILHGLSNNRFNRMSIWEARELVGYQPQDDLARENPVLRELELRH